MPSLTQPFFSILLVDDDEVDLMYVQREFKKLNLPVSIQVARDGVEALKTLYDEAILPKIIILDLMMPKMNGIELLQELRHHERFNNIDILILTTSNNEKDRIATKDLNVAGYYIKDSQFKDFITACKALL